MSVEFKKPSIEELESLIQKELKVNTIDSLKIRRGNDISIAPISVELEQPSIHIFPFLPYRVNFQYVQPCPDSVKEDNIRILNALENGASGLILDFNHKCFDSGAWDVLFANIQWDYIHTELLNTEGCDGLVPYLLSKTENINANHFGSNQGSDFSSILNIKEDGFLQNAAEIIAKAQDGLASSYIHIELSGDYFWDLCKIRAFKILFQNSLTKTQNKNTFLIVGEAIVSNDVLNNPQNQWIDLTTKAMSAIQSACDALWIKYIDYQINKNNDLSQRLSRNIYNILNEESYLNYVHDPGAGSYFIENYTHAIAKEIFKHIP